MKKIYIPIFFLLFAFLVIQIGCQHKKGNAAEEFVARVGNSVITKDMLNRELAAIQRMDPSFEINKETKMKQLQLMIDRMVLINEAKREKLDTKEEFIQAIQKYWEQTLIKDLYSQLRKKLEPTIVVSDEEIETLYKLKKYRISGNVGIYFSLKDAEDAAKKKNISKEWNEYFDINSSELPMEVKLAVLNLKEGQFSKPIKVNNRYYICQVTKKEENQLPPLEKVRDALRSEYKGYKLDRKIQQWINGIREKTKVEIYKDNL